MTSAGEPLWKLQRGWSPLLINVPHAGTLIPASLAGRLTPAALAVPDTDWQVDRLYVPAIQQGASLMVATHSRIVVDLNRDPSGAALYPGASNTELCPTSTFDDRPHYLDGEVPDGHEIEARRRQYWQPYHDRLAEEIEAIRARHGYCILLDGHSIRSRVPRFFEGRLPDFNLGTAEGASCSASLASRVFSVLSEAPGFTAVHNGRFKGGYITRHYGEPARGVHALQIEKAQAAYMNEDQPGVHDAPAAAPLRAVLARVVAALLDWKP